MGDIQTRQSVAELPRYRSHKVVRAAKIVRIEPEADDSATLVFEPPLTFLTVQPEYVRKHAPRAGGYFVVYEDGYQSWSPAAAFEEGYHLLPE